MDFSENLSVPIKYEPQTMHWYSQQITIHSGILFDNGNKSYHPYISVDKKHDQKFVRIVMDEMINNISSLPDVHDFYVYKCIHFLKGTFRVNIVSYFIFSTHIITYFIIMQSSNTIALKEHIFSEGE